MPDMLGEQLFGIDYWLLLKKIRAKTETFTLKKYQTAFRDACGNPDEFPAEYSLWGCAVSLRKFERDGEPKVRLRRFLNALGVLADTEESTADAPPLRISDELKPPAQKVTLSSSVYRQLIIRIVKCLTSDRSGVGGRDSDRFQVEAYTAETNEYASCCSNGGKECAPFSAHTLSATLIRDPSIVRRSRLKKFLQEEIPLSLSALVSHNPDLVQFVVPEELLVDFVITNQIDQILVLGGSEPLAEWRPTIFSGERLSRPNNPAGCDLLEKLTGAGPLRGKVISLFDETWDKRVRGCLKGAVAVVLNAQITGQRLLKNAPSYVPFVLVCEEKADAVVTEVSGLHCLCRLAHELHARQYDGLLPDRLPLIANTPNVNISFADAEEPIIVGNCE